MSYSIRSVVGPDAIDSNNNGELFGLAIPYNRVTNIGDLAHGGFREKIAPGSCSKSLRETDIVALWNHNSECPLGRTSIKDAPGSLILKNTTRGVEPTLRPTPTDYAKNLAINVKAKVVRGWSFGFEVIKDTWTDDDGQPSNEWVGTNRTINEMRLIEVSPVTFPAYEMTDISARDSLLREREIRAGQTMNSRTNIPKAQALATEAASTLIDVFNALLPEDVDSLPEELRKAFVAVVREVKKPHGDVAYADPGYLDADGNPAKDGNGVARYPIDMKHVQAAWSYINQAKNAGQYTPAQLSSIKGAIKAAMKKYGHDVSDDKSAEPIKVKRYNPITGKIAKRAKAKAARCTRCGGPLTCRACDIDISEDNDTPEGGTPDAGDNNNNPSNETTSQSVDNLIKRAKKFEKIAKRTRKIAKQAKRDAGDPMKDGTAKRIIQIVAEADAAIAALQGDKPDVDQALALLGSIKVHSGHISAHEDIDNDGTGSDADDSDSSSRSKRSDSPANHGGGDGRTVSDGDTMQCDVCDEFVPAGSNYCPNCGEMLGAGKSTETNSKKTSAVKRNTPKPDKSTSADVPDDDALRASWYDARSRENDLGL